MKTDRRFLWASELGTTAFVGWVRFPPSRRWLYHGAYGSEHEANTAASEAIREHGARTPTRGWSGPRRSQRPWRASGVLMEAEPDSPTR